jgi:hypothetical protein
MIEMPSAIAPTTIAQRHVLLLHDLGPQVVGRELVDEDEAQPEHHHADQRVQDGAEEGGRFQPFKCHGTSR